MLSGGPLDASNQRGGAISDDLWGVGDVVSAGVDGKVEVVALSASAHASADRLPRHALVDQDDRAVPSQAGHMELSALLADGHDPVAGAVYHAGAIIQLSIQLLDRAANWAEGDPAPGKDTSDYARLLEDLSASTTYAALVATMCSAVAFAVGITQQGWQERVLAAVVIGLLTHLGTTLLLVAVRVNLLTRARPNRAGTGRDRIPLGDF